MKLFCSNTLGAGLAACSLVLAGCATVSPPVVPTTPTVLVTPAPGESLAVFQQHDAGCRQYAGAQVSGQSSPQAAEQNQLGHAAAGAGVGAAAGALIGAASGHAGHGAAIGAAMGLLVGAVKSVQANAETAAVTQRNYDTSYAQCMVADGEHFDPGPASTVVVYRGVLVPRVAYVSSP